MRKQKSRLVVVEMLRPVNVRLTLLLLMSGLSIFNPLALSFDQPSPSSTDTTVPSSTELRATDDQILAAFTQASDGYGSDELVVNDALRDAFLTAIDPQWQGRGNQWQTETLLRLISLRKAGKLTTVTTKRGQAADDAVLPIAEIAVRKVMDEHQVSSDRLLCDAQLRNQLQQEAQQISGAVDGYEISKAVLLLRKSRRLRPELVLRVADWQRDIDVLSLQQVDQGLAQGTISTGPGVYLFRDKTGYLYIGEAVNLKARLQQHLSQSDRLSLRQYLHDVAKGDVTVELHSFGDESPARELTIRRAYESELIRSRSPRLNVRP